MKNVLFLLFRALFITMMTLGMMASMTEFRFGRRKLLLILVIYGLWVACSSLVLLLLGGELLLLRLFYFTISVPAILLTYYAANEDVYKRQTQQCQSRKRRPKMDTFLKAGLPTKTAPRPMILSLLSQNI